MRLMNRYVKHFLILLALFMQTVSAQSVANPKVTYFHNDITGTAVVATDEKGEVIWREQRRAYGEIKVDPLKPRSLDEFSVGYTGHQADKESGLTYAKARYYNKAIGRFYAPDPIPFRESDLVSINRYAYAGNNPYKYVDPTGEFFWFIIPAVAMYAGTSIQYANAPGPNDKIYGVTGLDEMTDEVISAHVPEEIRTTYEVVSTVTNVAKAAKGLDNVVNNIDADDAAKKVTTKASNNATEISAKGGDNLVYRGGSGTPTNLTPRPKDSGGLSANVNPLPGKNQVIDTSKLDSLCAVCDNPNTGHVSIKPKDMSQMQDWINTRGSGTTHPLTKELQNAVVDQIKN